MFEKQPLQTVQLAVLGQPLDGGDLFALAARRRRDDAAMEPPRMRATPCRRRNGWFHSRV